MRARKGFTLLEMVIVVAVISFLSFLVIPRLVNAWREDHKPSLTMHQQVNILARAVNKFRQDTGDWPFRLWNLNSPPKEWDLPPIGGTGKRIDPSSWKGPYLPKPSVPKDFHGALEYIDAKGRVWHVEYDHTKGSIALRQNNLPDRPIYIRPQET